MKIARRMDFARILVENGEAGEKYRELRRAGYDPMILQDVATGGAILRWAEDKPDFAPHPTTEAY